VLAIFDCTDALQSGDKKDASFIARTILPKLHKFDPEMNIVDIVFLVVQEMSKKLACYWPLNTHGLLSSMALSM
jgi:hypothetical protein